MQGLSGLAIAMAAVVLSAACASSALRSDQAELTPWSVADRDGWYWGTQGSRMIPARWLLALEQAGSPARFADEANLTGFGYLAAPATRTTRLPVGFAVDIQPDENLRATRLRWYAGQRGDSRSEPWVGLNCSACHTAQIEAGGQPLRIDGGPGMGDFDAMIAALDAALVATRADPEKWGRFACRVFVDDGQALSSFGRFPACARTARDTAANRRLLGQAIDQFIAWQRRTEQLNRPTRPRAGDVAGEAGFARVDAFGHIYNKTLMFADNTAGASGSAANPADAPVSYPHLWNIHRQHHVQWNGIAQNASVAVGAGALDYGALGRNTGEVLGVFGEAVVLPADRIGQRLRGFGSSVNIRNLDRLEQLVARLSPPPWPAAVRPINTVIAGRGRDLFVAQCAACHKTPDMVPPGQPTEVMLTFQQTAPSDLTDIWMACNAWSYDGATGQLAGTRDGFVSGSPFGATAPVAAMLTSTVKGVLVRGKGDVVAAAMGNFVGLRRPPVVIQLDEDAAPGAAKAARGARCRATDHSLLAYKARPLDGIWATAPFLHNGSVPTLYDLLLPAARRPASFRLGTRRYDLDRVGYATMAQGGWLYRTVDDAGRPVPGNSNAGHEYGAGALTEPDRLALLEYLKTL